MQIIKLAYLECVIPSLNRRAFYLIQAEIDLYGFMLIRKWGRIGTKGSRPLKIRFQNKEDLMKEFGRVLTIRFSRKYILRKQIEGGEGRAKIKIRIFNDNLLQDLAVQQKEPFLGGLNRFGCEDQRQLRLFQAIKGKRA
ncbi:MAG: hypothetical protein ACD_74C00069G0018 [uncultured bacterium]|jgi:predicted DNA-binding WGR domain protein|nr:MAG: hypothetical protein ACD_74C00069G0018 [uncultured bacterium]